MSDVDTSILARLRLSATGSVDLHHTHYRKDCADAVAEIERITAERDALRARESDLLAENDALRFALNNASADVTRLRRSWLATIQTENSCPATGGGCLSKRCGCLEEMEMLMREDDARTLPIPPAPERGA